MTDTVESSGSDRAALLDVVAVVVHHRSYSTVPITVASLLDEGLALANIVLVDNSEEPHARAALEASLPANLSILYTKNDGYGAAVNTALDYFGSKGRVEPTYLVVATHETRPRDGAIKLLVDSLAADGTAAVAGPTLISGDGSEEYVWSAGGYLSKSRHLPRHFSHRSELTEAITSGSPQCRVWLDGAFLVYRWRDISEFRVSEAFFLYMEETDLHLRFAEAGLAVLWVPRAIVWQSSGGVPAFYFARNLRLLFRRHDSVWRRVLVVPTAVARNFLAESVRTRSVATLLPSAHGLVTRIQANNGPKTLPLVTIVNPLGGALQHYERETESVLRSAGVRTAAFASLEPSQGGSSRASWLFKTLQLFGRVQRIGARDATTRALVLWPVIGYFDLFILRVLRVRASVVMHDPTPLVRAVGYGRLARWLATVRSSGRVGAIVLSAEASAALASNVPGLAQVTLAHPVLLLAEPHPAGVQSPMVRVLGQYKKERDTRALAAIARDMSGEATFEIHGRGWPTVEGWTVDPTFVTESELDRLISSSSVVLIPYRRFFQSGIAFRCLERGVPVVGPRDSNLSEVLGSGSPLLVASDSDGDSDWVRAVRHAIAAGDRDARKAATDWRERCESEWRAWIVAPSDDSSS